MHRSLDPFFQPDSVAVIGASATPGSIGQTIMRNLMRSDFNGVVYPVNPRRRAVFGVHCYPRLSDVPDRVDLAVIATPAATVPGVVRECVERDVKGAIIISAGFAEIGTAGRALEAEIRDVARGRMRIIGPNCLGVIRPAANFNASFASATPSAGSVALLSQSGAILTSILDWARDRNIGFSSFVSVGSMLDVDMADLIDYLADDPQTKSILLYLESVGNVRRFLSAARAVARTKPVIVVKAGRHEAGARAAASHTGAIAGRDAVFDAAFRRVGILRVTTIPELFNMAEILALQPPPQGPSLAIITNAGGPGVMATDALMLAGGKLAELSAATVAALNEALPAAWSHSNPIDILGDAPPDRFRRAIEVCAADPHVDGILVLLTPQAMTNPSETARQVAPFAHLRGKPLLASWLGGHDVREGRGILNLAGIPTFESPEAAIQAFLNMVRYRRNLDLLYEAPAVVPEDVQPDIGQVQSIIATVRADERELLTEVEAKQVLSAYGVPVNPTEAATNVEEAVRAAGAVGYPVVLKLLSATVTHKSDVGGVQLGLRSEADVRDAFARIQSNLVERGQAAAFDGVTVQPMIEGQNYELIVGSSLDPQFGPVLLFGAGGVLVEILKDTALALPPLTRTLARRMLERTKIYEALQGVRGRAPVPLAELELLLVRFSRLVADVPDIAEIEINPLVIHGRTITALDARATLAPRGADATPAPRLAIHPYPNQYTAPFRLKDGREVLVRTIRPEDEAMIVELHARHSDRTLWMRFFSLVRTLSRESLIRFCHLDFDREMAFVAVWRDAAQRPQIVGVARYYLHTGTGEAEFAVVVTDDWQGQGLGRHLLQRVIDVARERGVRELNGPVLRENSGMLQLVRALGFSIETTDDPTVVSARLPLSPSQPTRNPAAAVH